MIEENQSEKSNHAVNVLFYTMRHNVYSKTSLVRARVEEGLVSLFEGEKDVSAQVAAHGLGPKQGLKHRALPLDLISVRLLDRPSVRKARFCNACQQKLENTLIVKDVS